MRINFLTRRIRDLLTWVAIVATVLALVPVQLLTLAPQQVHAMANVVLPSYGERVHLSSVNCPAYESSSLYRSRSNTVNVTPSQDWQNAIQSAGSGTEVVLAPGIYNLNRYALQISSGVTVRGASGNAEDVLIQGQGFGVGSEGFQIVGNNVTIADVSMTGMRNHAISFKGELGADNPLVYNVRLYNIGTQAIKGTPQNTSNASIGVENPVVACSTMGFNSLSDVRGDYIGAIDIHDSRNAIIRDNLIYNMIGDGSGCEVDSNCVYSDTTPAILIWNDAVNTTVERNVFVNNSRSIAFGLGRGHDGGLIQNNFFYGDRPTDVSIEFQQANGISIVNNSFHTQTFQNINQAVGGHIGLRNGVSGINVWNNLAAPMPHPSSGTVSGVWNRNGASVNQQGNIWNAQPGVDYLSATDLHLTAQSRAIDAAATVAIMPADDIDSQNRSGVVDVGADERRNVAPPPPPPPADRRALRSQDLVPLGAFRLPTGSSGGLANSNFAYGGNAMAFNPYGDQNGANDGFPGSLLIVGHDYGELVAEVNIPVPTPVSQGIGASRRAQYLSPFVDVTGGRARSLDQGNGFTLEGLEILPPQAGQSGPKIYWTARPYYNVGGGSHNSHGMANLNPNLANLNPTGMWRLGNYHANMTAGYIFAVPSYFADEYLSSRRLISGLFTQQGVDRTSQGPAMFSYGPWLESGVSNGTRLGTNALVYYPYSVAGGTPVSGDPQNIEPVSNFPDYQIADSWGGATWVYTENAHGVVVVGERAMGITRYGEPGPNDCWPYRGYRGDPYEARMVFYDPDDLARVSQGQVQPQNVVPYEEYNPMNELYQSCQHVLAGAAYDAQNQLLYVMQQDLQPVRNASIAPLDGNRPIIYVYRVDTGSEPPPLPVDNDGDGYSEALDCNDNNPNINPGASEIPLNNIDDNCNGQVDENNPPPPPADNDEDGYDENVDCNDNNANIHPGAQEIPFNNIDDNCNGQVDENNPPPPPPTDNDGDGSPEGEDCNDNNPNQYPENREVVGNGWDDDCNPSTSDDLPPPDLGDGTLEVSIAKDAFIWGRYGNTGGMGTLKLYRESGGEEAETHVLLQPQSYVLPAGAALMSAKLRMYHSSRQYGTAQRIVCLHRVNQSWDEGNGVHEFDSGASGVTWTRPRNGASWRAGGNYGSQCLVSASLSNTAGSFIEFDVTNHLDAPHGYLLRPQTGDWRQDDFASSEASSAQRPTLVVEYDVPDIDSDYDNDGVEESLDCNDRNPSISPHAPELIGNGVDDNCNGEVDESLPAPPADVDGDGYDENVDCNDTDASVNPGATEVPGNGKDDDCNPDTSDEVPPPPQVDDISSEGLVSHLKLDFGGADYSGRGNSGLAIADTSFALSGRINGAATFDGQGDFLSVGNTNDINLETHAARTVSLWFKAEDLSKRQVLYEEGGGSRGLSIYVEDGELYVAGWNLPSSESNWSGTYLATGKVYVDTWHHVILTLFGGSSVTDNAFVGYLDGNEFGAGQGSQLWGHGGGIGIGAVNGGTRFADGQSAGTGEAAFAGQIDEVRVYNRRISSSEASQLAQFDNDQLDQEIANDPISRSALVLQLTFSSFATDYSGFGNSGTLRNGASIDSAGKVGTALRLDGQNDYVSFADSSEINLGTHQKRSISLWFNAQSTSARQVLFEEGGTVRGLNLFVENGRAYVGGWNEPTDESGWDGTFIDLGTISAGAWNHVALTLDGEQILGTMALRGYLNGQLKGQSVGSQLWQHTGNFAVGAVDNDSRFFETDESAGTSRFFGGLIDDVRVYNRVLTPTEVSALAQ